MQAVALWARSMYVQAKAWVMLSEEMPWIGRVSLELVWMTEISAMGLGMGTDQALRGLQCTLRRDH